jgi:hypothetical protein
MIEGLDTVLWIAGICFVICLFFRSWWVAALIIAGITAIAAQQGAPLQTLLVGAAAIGVPALGGTALGKFIRRRTVDPFDPTTSRTPPT